MKKMSSVSIIFLVLAVSACGGSSQGANSAADADLSPIEQLQALSTNLEAGVNNLMQPITDVEVVADQVTSLPDRLGLDLYSVMTMAKATMDRGQISVMADLGLAAEARLELETVLHQVQLIATGLKETPSRAMALLTQAGAATAQLPILATKVTTMAQAKLANPLANAASKAQAQADMAAVVNVQADVEMQISDIQAQIKGIPVLAAEALAKLAGAFAGEY
jgi:hypothetical protein